MVKASVSHPLRLHLSAGKIDIDGGHRTDDLQSELAVTPPRMDYTRNQMALITSDCDAMRIHDHQMALITSDRRPRVEARGAGSSSHNMDCPPAKWP